MATATTLVSLEEYLHTRYRPDCDYVEGRLEERNLGELPHSTLQTELAFWFRLHSSEWHIKPLVEQRIQVKQTSYRVCDLCLLDPSAPREDITSTPPLLCVEILSPDDRLARAVDVLEDYRQMGVPVCWLVDPSRRLAYVFDASGLSRPVLDRLQLPDSPIYVDLATLFAALD